jgi:GMP synthase (glutamine-hydrolysing)
MLKRLDPSLECEILRAADGPVALPGGAAIADYDGCVMTGSALNVYDGGAAILRQIDLVKAILSVGIPFFGSCWGLQVATVAAGIAARHPLKRCGDPVEIGGGVVYLCSPAASFVTGSELVIDGGFTAI